MLNDADLFILNQLTGDNMLPSRLLLNGMERCQIKLLESHVCSQMQAEQEKIEALKIQPNAAEEAQNQLLEQLRTLRRAITPWADLPAEILSQIFRYSKEPIHFPVRRSNIWSISHVCSSWRQVALDEPVLWTDIRSRFSPWHEDEPALAVLENLLARSGNRSISLSLSCASLPWDNTEFGIPFFTVIGTAVRRVSSLSLHEVSPKALHELRTTLERLDLPLFPHASKLEIFSSRQLREWPSSRGVYPEADLIIHMPDVSRLVMGAIDETIGRNIHEFNSYPWSQFKEITLLKFQLAISDALKILRQASQLSSVKFQIAEGDVGTFGMALNPASGAVQLPRLEEMVVIVDQYDGPPADALVMALFAPLSTPSLKRLSLAPIKIAAHYDTLNLEEDEPDHVMRYLFTLQSLRSLRLEGCINVDINRLLVELPGLQDLVIHPAESNRLSRESILTLASQQRGVNLRNLHCLVAKEDVEVFVLALTEQWTRCCDQGFRTRLRGSVCLHDAVISVECETHWLKSFNQSVQDLEKQLGVEFSAQFNSLHDTIVTYPARF